MKTVSIKGKPYVMVNERIKALRKNFAGHRIITSWIKVDMEEAICFASIKNEQGEVIATGTAFERAGSGLVNKTSHIENAETSAVGRALGMFGIGIDESIATAEEVTNAVKGQNTPMKVISGGQSAKMVSGKQVQIIKNMLKKTKSNIDKFKEVFSIGDIADLTEQQALEAIRLLGKKKNE